MKYSLDQLIQADIINTYDSHSFFSMIGLYHLEDEAKVVKGLSQIIKANEISAHRIRDRTYALVDHIRKSPKSESALDALLREYNLTTQEGLMLMSLAEAFLRIPDKTTADSFIQDKIATTEWQEHRGKSNKSLVNFTTLGLMATGKISRIDAVSSTLKKLGYRFSAAGIRSGVRLAMKIMGGQFVLGQTIQEAIKNGQKGREKGYTYTFDMLGEAAITESDAKRYFDSYHNAISAIASQKTTKNSPKPSLSIKLSALHPRYSADQKERVMDELYERLKALVLYGIEQQVEISIDAEEADRLELSLALFKKVMLIPKVSQWGGLGLVIQGYAKHALPTIIWSLLLAKELKTIIPVRLVKGAYWDTEIKDSQVRGLNNFPVFTRKENTDVSYLACAYFMLSPMAQNLIKPQFATHNVHTVNAILEYSQQFQNKNFEFQRLHGMGEALYDQIIKQEQVSVRVYAPVGLHHDLLPYLVRRLLENGANSSFVHQLIDPNVPIKQLATHPLDSLEQHHQLQNPNIVLSDKLYTKETLAANKRYNYNVDRLNSRGLNTNFSSIWEPFASEFYQQLEKQWSAKPIINGHEYSSGQSNYQAYSPFDLTLQVGEVITTSKEQAQEAIQKLDEAWFEWNQTSVEQRAQILEKTADLLERDRVELIAICSMEAGKTIDDGVAEVREAADFCRYYAAQARKHEGIHELTGPSGEKNLFYHEGKGVFACISPWNFPLAIYLGQISAALVTGNTVIAKPAETTPLIAYKVVQLLFEAGLPKNVLAFLPGSGKDLGDVFTYDPRVVGVCFTGSTTTARVINQNLAKREGNIATLIAETGGQNVMFVDSTALPEQVVKDALESAFGSAGQRCSALRVLYLQEDIADRIIALLKEAMNDLVLGKPYFLKTDIGPIIDEKAKNGLLEHINTLKKAGKLIAESPLDSDLNGHFVAPCAFELDSIQELTKEHFGPIMHIIRYKKEEVLEKVSEVNQTGFGLTMGVHSRNEQFVKDIEKHARVGNFYVNRNQVGAIVGVQPFGGRGLSGTGPKAGGPHYLTRFMTERSTSINTAAIGGDAALISSSFD